MELRMATWQLLRHAAHAISPIPTRGVGQKVPRQQHHIDERLKWLRVLRILLWYIPPLWSLRSLHLRRQGGGLIFALKFGRPY